MRFLKQIAAVGGIVACTGLALGHGINVGRTIDNRLAVSFEETMPFPLEESNFPGVPGFAEAGPGFSSLEKDEGDLLMLEPLSEIEFVLLNADSGMQVWNDRGDAPMAIGEAFYLGFPEFSEHPVWNMAIGQIGDIKSLTVQLHDRTGLATDSAAIVMTFEAVPEPSSALLLIAGLGLMARRRIS